MQRAVCAAVDLGRPAWTPRRAIGPFREQLDHAPHRVGAEQGGVGAAHDLDAVQVLGRQVAEIEAAAGLVERHAVEQHLVVVALAAANEERRQRAGRAAPNHHGAGRRHQHVGDERLLPPLQVFRREDSRAGADLTGGRLGPRRRHDHRFVDRRDGELDAQRLSGRGGRARNDRRLKSGERRFQAAVAGASRAQREAPGFVGEHAALPGARCVHHADVGTRHGAARLIDDGARKLAPVRGRGSRGSAGHEHDEQNRDHETG